MPSAHPLSPLPDLGAPPLGVALAGMAVVAAVLAYGRFRPVTERAEREPGRWTAATRALSVAVLLLMIYAGRFGTPDERDNIAPAFVIGAAWPLLLVAALLLGRTLWRAVDPWGAIVGLLERVAGGTPSVRTTAYAALPAAVAWMTYLNGYTGALRPRAVGAALAAYTIAVVAVGVAAGRAALRDVDVFGAVADWTGRWRGGGLATWRTPPGAECVAGALVGGMAFAELRIAPWWLRFQLSERRATYSILGALGCCAAGAIAAYGLERWARRRDAAGSVAAALVPMLPAYAVATQLNRLLNSVQIVRERASDPFGRGWDLFGTADAGVDDTLLTTLQLRWTNATILTIGGVLGAIVLARRVRERRAQDPAATALYLAVGLGILGVTTSLGS